MDKRLTELTEGGTVSEGASVWVGSSAVSLATWVDGWVGTSSDAGCVDSDTCVGSSLGWDSFSGKFPEELEDESGDCGKLRPLRSM